MDTPVLTGDDLARFQSFFGVPVPETGCWLNKASPATEYGDLHLRRLGRSAGMHRLMAALVLNRPLLREEFVLHKCDIRRCCNHSHLFLGDQPANVADMLEKNRQSQGMARRMARASAPKASGLPPGVSLNKRTGHFLARAWVAGASVTIGTFLTKELAGQAYDTFVHSLGT